MTVLESKLRRQAASLDAAALEALTSKGLLRRAQKDLERGIDTQVTGETASTLRLKVGEFEVALPESGPATATCTCPAVGVCQHILTAVLFLQQTGVDNTQEQLPGVSVAETSISPEQELMAITPERLEQWAGKTAFKAGLKLAGEFSSEIVRERAIRIRFLELNSEIHFIPGGGLDGMIVSGGRSDDRQLIVAAVVGFQRANGMDWNISLEAAGLEASEGAPRTRAEVLDSCQTLMEETLNNGLSRISATNQQRWATLAVSALGVNLPRLALALRGIGDESALVIARDARSDSGRMLGRMAQTHALCAALQNGGESPRADLVGMHRTRYDEIGRLDLAGAAAWPWRTASGYEGLTLLFWDSSGKRWHSWTESRPSHQLADFRPVARYTQPGPWEGAESPRQLARSNFRLINARRNPGQRLSSSGKSRVLVTGAVNLQEQRLVVIEDWTQLTDIVSALAAFGLKQVNPLDSIVALKPAVWGQRAFDPVTQVFRWMVADVQQQALLLEIAFEEFTEPAIQFLERSAPDFFSEAMVIGRIQRTPAGVTVHPYSIHRQNGEIIHLCLDNVTANATKPPVVSIDEDEMMEEEEETASAPVFNPALNRLLDEVDNGLLALAEAGLASVSQPRVENIRQVVPRADRLGLEGLTGGLANVIHRPRPQAVLRCAYLSQLHRSVS